MIILKFFFSFLKFSTFCFFILINYVVLLFVKLFYFFTFLPFSLYFIFKTFINLVFLFLKFLFNYMLNISLKLFLSFKTVYVYEPLQQLFFHFTFLIVLKEKLFRRYYFYRRLYWVCGSSTKFLIKGMVLVESNALLIKRLIQPIPSLLLKIWDLPSSYTRIGYTFRVIRRVIKLFLGLFTFFYPLQLGLKFGIWYFTDYFLRVVRILRRRGILKNKKVIKKLLKFTIWLKLLFVWSDLPFILLFKPGISKKYPQFEDIQPDTKVIKNEVWDFALSRDCYFDYDDAMNGYYIFHKVRRLSKFFFNLIIFNFVAAYFLIVNFLYLLQIFYFLTYIPFKFFYLSFFFNLPVLVLKFILVFGYFIPVFLFLLVLMFLYFIYKFYHYKFKFFFSQKLLMKPISNVWMFVDLKFIKERFYLILYYIIFKFRSLNYLLPLNFNKLASMRGLLNINSIFNLSNVFKINPIKANLLYYNTSFVFKRIRPYLLRFNNIQFVPFFSKVQKVSRVTPDQLKSFFKIGQNSRYPADYFEKLFDMEYSRLELEYEVPYYWSFVRQAHSFNEGLLHPKFHVYGFLNFIKFYWNYFSFLNATASFEFSAIYAQDFVQLLNSSASQIFSLLINDFILLLNIKKFKKYLAFSNHFNLPTGYFKFSTTINSTQWYFLHFKYYDRLIHFFWEYYDKAFIRVIYYYYFLGSSKRAVKIYSFFNSYAEKARHLVGWHVFLFFERLMGKLFLNINKFEDYYDINFDKSLDRYDKYSVYLNFFFGVAFNPFLSKHFETQNKVEDSSLEKESIRFLDYEKKMNLQRKKNYNETMSDFFVGSFSLLGNFYTFARDNIFEFMTVLSSLWRDYFESSISKWFKLKKLLIFLIYFFNTLFIVWFFVTLLVVFSLFFVAKSTFIIIIKKIKKIYV